MRLRELILSVDETRFHDIPLFQKLKSVKPEYGSSLRINVKRSGEHVDVTNVHVGSLGDILTGIVDVAPDVYLCNEQLLLEILKEMSRDGFTETEAADFWYDMKDISKAKIIR